MDESQAAIITKHDFLIRLEEHCRSKEGLRELRELFEDPDVERTLDYFRSNELLDADVSELVRDLWLGKGGAFPNIRELTENGFREALAEVDANGPHLSAWILIGASRRYDVRVLSLGDVTLLLILVPRLPERPPSGKGGRRPYGKLTADPGFRKHLEAIQDFLGKLGL